MLVERRIREPSGRFQVGARSLLVEFQNLEWLPKSLTPNSFPSREGEQSRRRSGARRLVLVLDAGAAGVVVDVNVGGIFVARFFVRAVAKRLVLRESARADVNRQLGAFGDFVGCVLFVSDHSSHEGFPRVGFSEPVVSGGHLRSAGSDSQ